MERLILASSSAYRRSLLERLAVAFEVIVRPVNENPRAGEGAQALAQRLALAKAQAVAAEQPRAWVIGSDQTCEAGSRILGKPGGIEQAVEQLVHLSGTTAIFHTAVTLLCRSAGATLQRCVPTRVSFRRFDLSTAMRYLAQEAAIDCAGSFKAEGLGITLCERIESDDPTALIGLPLITLRELLAEAGWPLP